MFAIIILGVCFLNNLFTLLRAEKKTTTRGRPKGSGKRKSSATKSATTDDDETEKKRKQKMTDDEFLMIRCDSHAMPKKFNGFSIMCPSCSVKIDCTVCHTGCSK